MSDLSQYFALLNIESRIASVGRDAARASAASTARISQRIDQASERMQSDFLDLRTDMLDGLSGIDFRIKSITTDVGNGFRRLDLRLAENQVALRSMGLTLDIVSKNIATGFLEVLDRLETIQGTLDRIEHSVANPEKAIALERYRDARILAQKGRPIDALELVNIAIANEGGPALLYVPELRMLRGKLFLGDYDTEAQTVLNPTAALEEFREAVQFAKSKAIPEIEAYLAVSCFALQDYHGAYDFYARMSNSAERAEMARFQMARCMLEVGRLEDAKQLLSRLIKDDASSVLLFAADPVCQKNADVISEIMTEHRRNAVVEFMSLVKEVRSEAGAPAIYERLYQNFNAMITLPESVAEDLELFFDEREDVRHALTELDRSIEQEKRAEVILYRLICPQLDSEDFNEAFDLIYHDATLITGTFAALSSGNFSASVEVSPEDHWADVQTSTNQLRNQISDHLDVLSKVHDLYDACRKSLGGPQKGGFPKNSHYFDSDLITAPTGMRFEVRYKCRLAASLVQSIEDSLRPPKPGFIKKFLKQPIDVDEDLLQEDLDNMCRRLSSEIVTALAGRRELEKAMSSVLTEKLTPLWEDFRTCAEQIENASDNLKTKQMQLSDFRNRYSAIFAT